MIIKFNIYNESLLDNLKGPKEKDALEINPTGVLLQAFVNNDLRLFNLALEYGADIEKNHSTNEIKNKPLLIYSIFFKMYEFSKLLIEYGANIKDDYFLELLGADGNIDMIEYVLDRYKFTFEQYKKIIKSLRVNEQEILSLVNKYIQKNVTKDVSKPWKPYVGVHNQPINKFVKKYLDENE